jgi:Tfp pilus assembly protein PilW
MNNMRLFNKHKLSEEPGFTAIEFLISSLILLIISAAVFSMLSDVQRTASNQAEMQSVVNGSFIAFQTIERCIRQAGNNPSGIHGTGIKIINSTEMQIQSDLTGSLGPGSPDKGDPDGDVNDSGENISIRYNRAARSIELVPVGGAAQIVAGNISDFLLQYYDIDGNPTDIGSDVREIRIVIKAVSPANRPNNRNFGMEIGSDVRIAI